MAACLFAFVLLATVPDVLAYRALTGTEALSREWFHGCYCKKVASREECHGPNDSKAARRFYREDPKMCCKFKQFSLKRFAKYALTQWKEMDREMCEETLEIPVESCCHFRSGNYAFGLHIGKATSKAAVFHGGANAWYLYKDRPMFQAEDIVAGDGNWSAKDVRQVIENFKAKNPKAKLMCNQPLHKVIKDRGTCKLFEKVPVISGCCCPLGDVAHPTQCLPVAGASTSKVVQQMHWITKSFSFDYAGQKRKRSYAKDVPHEDIKVQDSNMPFELTAFDPDMSDLPEFAREAKNFTWTKVEQQYTSECVQKEVPKPFVKEGECSYGHCWHQEHGPVSCPEVKYTRICPPGEGLFRKTDIPTGQCLWSANPDNTDEMQLRFAPQYQSVCPFGYTFGGNDWLLTKTAPCKCSARIVKFEGTGMEICDPDPKPH